MQERWREHDAMGVTVDNRKTLLNLKIIERK